MDGKHGDCCCAIFNVNTDFQMDTIVYGDDTACMEHIDVIFHAVIVDCDVKLHNQTSCVDNSNKFGLVCIYLELVFGGFYIN